MEIEKKNEIFGKRRICEMETRDLLKIATCGRLMVIRVMRTAMGEFEVKRMKSAMYPVGKTCSISELDKWKWRWQSQVA